VEYPIFIVGGGAGFSEGRALLRDVAKQETVSK